MSRNIDGNVVLVTELKYKHLADLVTLLELRRSWYDLGKIIFHNDNEAKDDLDIFENASASPAIRFMESLVKRLPDITINKFYGIALQLKRCDVTKYIESLGKDYVFILLSTLTSEQTCRIAKLLGRTVPGIHDWRMFADNLGYTYQEIESIRLTPRHIQRPSECLFALLRRKNPSMTINDLVKYLKIISRNDIVSYLNSNVLLCNNYN